MHDWCISRQLWWGHRIPVYYGPEGEVVCVGPDDEILQGYTQDPDVLDTWFSSGLWPFSTLGWPEQTDDLKKFYPTTVLVTGYDILFFWVARMMMFGLYAMDGQPPFKTVALHGMVRDQYGKKMSKSFGNVIDPLDWIARYGADATRFTLLRGANPGSDVAISEDWAAGSRNFCNKIWNATRFALMNGAVSDGLPEELTAADRWILSRLQSVVGAGRHRLRRLRVRQDQRRALPLRVGRGLRLVPGAREDPDRRRRPGRREHQARPRPRLRRAAAPAPSADPVRHRGAVARGHRQGVDRGGAVAGE